MWNSRLDSQLDSFYVRPFFSLLIATGQQSKKSRVRVPTDAIPYMYAPILESNHPGESFACSQYGIHSVMFRLKVHFVVTLECTPIRFCLQDVGTPLRLATNGLAGMGIPAEWERQQFPHENVALRLLAVLA